MEKMYRLKPGQDSFDVVDGPLAGARFTREWAYTADEIPKNERHRFEVIPASKGGDDPLQAAKDEADKQNFTAQVSEKTTGAKDRKQTASGSGAGDKKGGTKK